MSRLTWDEIEEDFNDSISYENAVESYADSMGYVECDECGLYSDETLTWGSRPNLKYLCLICYEEAQTAQNELERAAEKGLHHIEVDPRQITLEVAL